ncbi:MAG: hypothetical protein ACM358_17660 [Gemmatimonadota bacterium]
MNTVHRALVVAPVIAFLTACSSTEPNAMHHVTVSAAIASATVHAVPGLSADLIVGDETGSVSISSAQIVLSRLKLQDGVCSDDEGDDAEGEDADTLDADDAPVVVSDEPDDPDTNETDEENEEEDGDEDEGCAPLSVGPALIDLPLDGTTAVVLDAFVPAGTYQRLQARLHAVKPGDAGVADFLAAHPEFEGISVKVVGVFTDAGGANHDFTFTSKLNVVSAINFETPVTVDAGTTNLTINVDVGSWFTSGSGAVIDPTNADNQNAIAKNIRRSLRAFEDDDHDGDEDGS